MEILEGEDKQNSTSGTGNIFFAKGVKLIASRCVYVHMCLGPKYMHTILYI
jgi:hypothetical protein